MVKIYFFADFFSKTPAECTLQEVVHLIKTSTKLKSNTESYRLALRKRSGLTRWYRGRTASQRGCPKATRKWTAFLTLSNDRMTLMTVFFLNPYACTQELLKI